MGGDRLLRRPHYFLEGLLITHSQVRKYLSVETQTRLIETVDQSTVRAAMLSSCSCDTNNPKPAKLSLLLSSVPVGIGERLEDLLFGSLMQLALGSPIALGLSQNFLPA